jgi:predicted membrane protein
VLAILFTVLANRTRVRALRIISLVFWAILAMILFSVGWFWLALIFPALTLLTFWKNNPRESSRNFRTPPYFQSESEENTEDFTENLGKTNGNDLIDLYDVNFKPSGNSLSIKKITGNTKIIVPHDVAVMLDITSHSGLVKIFDEAAKINAGNVRYFSENLNQSEKRIKISIRVETGNIEVVRG